MLMQAIAYINSFEEGMAELGFHWEDDSERNPLKACDAICKEIKILLNIKPEDEDEEVVSSIIYSMTVDDYADVFELMWQSYGKN